MTNKFVWDELPPQPFNVGDLLTWTDDPHYRALVGLLELTPPRTFKVSQVTPVDPHLISIVGHRQHITFEGDDDGGTWSGAFFKKAT